MQLLPLLLLLLFAPHGDAQTPLTANFYYADTSAYDVLQNNAVSTQYLTDTLSSENVAGAQSPDGTFQLITNLGTRRIMKITTDGTVSSFCGGGTPFGTVVNGACNIGSFAHPRYIDTAPATGAFALVVDVGSSVYAFYGVRKLILTPMWSRQ